MQFLIRCYTCANRFWLINNLGLSTAQLFKQPEAILKQLISTDERLTELQKEQEKITEAFEKIAVIGLTISPNLSKSMKAHQAKHARIIKRVREKFQSHLMQLEEDKRNALDQLHDNLFPNNSLQERQDNFLTMYKKYGENFIPQLMQHMKASDNLFLQLQ
jgi:bacillithiol synthase